MAVSNALMTETIELGLNEVFYDNYNMVLPPMYAKLSDIFMEESSKKRAEYDLEMRGVGRFRTKGEEEDIFEDFIKEKYKTTFVHVTYADSVPVTKEYIEDELYNIVKTLVGELGDSARDTQYFNAFSVFRNAFSSSYLGADSKPLCATDHPRDWGGTLNNKMTDKLSSQTLDEMIVRMAEQTSHAGKLITNVPATLLVPPARFKQAVELTEAELQAGTANNDPNIFSAKYNIAVKMSPYIGAAMGGSDDAFFLLAKRHKVKRFIRVPTQTWMTPWDLSRKTVTYYNARYRESVGWSAPIGIIGSDGTTGSY